MEPIAFRLGHYPSDAPSDCTVPPKCALSAMVICSAWRKLPCRLGVSLCTLLMETRIQHMDAHQEDSAREQQLCSRQEP